VSCAVLETSAPETALSFAVLLANVRAVAPPPVIRAAMTAAAPKDLSAMAKAISPSVRCVEVLGSPAVLATKSKNAKTPIFVSSTRVTSADLSVDV
jgi:hypothetical protein